MSERALIIMYIVLLVFVISILSRHSALKDTKNISQKKEMVRCIDGVQYYYLNESGVYSGYGYFGAAFNRDGTVKTCN